MRFDTFRELVQESRRGGLPSGLVLPASARTADGRSTLAGTVADQIFNKALGGYFKASGVEQNSDGTWSKFDLSDPGVSSSSRSSKTGHRNPNQEVLNPAEVSTWARSLTSMSSPVVKQFKLKDPLKACLIAAAPRSTADPFTTIFNTLKKQAEIVKTSSQFIDAPLPDTWIQPTGSSPAVGCEIIDSRTYSEFYFAVWPPDVDTGLS